MSRWKNWLSVFVIVAVLLCIVAVFLPAVYLGLNSAPGYGCAVELIGLAASIEDYKRSVHVEYPPNFGDADAVLQHVQKKFMQFDPTAEGVTLPPHNLDPAEALVFWLQGYGPNPHDPLAIGQRLFSFDETRLRDADQDGWPEYYPRNSDLPYVYFHCDSYPHASFSVSKKTGISRAYLSDDRNEKFANPNSFQIICAGYDGKYGHGGSFPSGKDYADGDWDNVTNFSDGSDLRAKR